jgi:hypothetical protein
MPGRRLLFTLLALLVVLAVLILIIILLLDPSAGATRLLTLLLGVVVVMAGIVTGLAWVQSQTRIPRTASRRIASRLSNYYEPDKSKTAEDLVMPTDDELDIPAMDESIPPGEAPPLEPQPIPQMVEYEEEMEEPAQPPMPPGSIPRMKSSEEAEGVLFSGYYPKEIKPQDWQPLKAYIFKESAGAAVAEDVKAELGDLDGIRETTRPAEAPIAEDALVTATPQIAGFEFDPPTLSVRFRKDWRRFDFEFQAVDVPSDTAANGQITFTVEGVIVADVPLSVHVSDTLEAAAPQQTITSQPYQAIFCSYSHKDTAIVERVEAAYKILRIEYLRDVTTLRSGQHWDEELLNMIDQADIFQLFWSEHSKASKYVEQEWRHALNLMAAAKKNEHFIRPVRWQEPMPVPPPELSHIHFAYEPELDT